MQTINKPSLSSLFDDQNLFSSFVEGRSWEPGWCADFRMENWNHYETLRNSVFKDENWRFSPKSRFSLSGVNHLTSDVDLLSLSSSVDSKSRFQDLNKMILDFPSEVSSIISLKGPSLGALSNYHLTSALFDNGYFLNTATGNEPPEVFTVRHKLPISGSISFRKNVLTLAPFSEITVFEFIESDCDSNSGNLSSILHAEIGEGAKLNRILIQDAKTSATLHQFENFVIGKNANVTNTTIHLGSSECRTEIKGNLMKEGAEFENFSLFLGCGDQLFDQRTMQFHAAPNCRSNLISKNALNDESKSVFSGMIKVLPSASNTNAYQTNRNLLLSNEAQADSLPGLEILANEVKCSHGATTSKIDEQELFYLQSRGIPKKSAENLIALGFLEEILAMVKNEELNESIRHKIESRFNNL